MDELEQYKKELADSGVDVVEDEKSEATEDEANAPKDEAPKEKVEKENQDKVDEPQHKQPEVTEIKKRSIYDEYKEKKNELKSEKELRLQVELERDELKQKLENLGSATTKKEIAEAKDEIDAFAIERGLDPEAIKQMKTLFLKDIQPSVDPALQVKLDKVLEFANNNSKAIEAQQFEQEFTLEGLPAVKEFFPNINSDEITSVKKEIDRLAHTKGFEDKSLDYIVYKNKDTLSALVSPKKRGLESKSRADGQEVSDDFNSQPDFSKMTYKELLAWQEKYEKMAKEDSSSQGKKILL